MNSVRLCYYQLDFLRLYRLCKEYKLGISLRRTPASFSTMAEAEQHLRFLFQKCVLALAKKVKLNVNTSGAAGIGKITIFTPTWLCATYEARIDSNMYGLKLSQEHQRIRSDINMFFRDFTKNHISGNLGTIIIQPKLYIDPVVGNLSKTVHQIPYICYYDVARDIADMIAELSKFKIRIKEFDKKTKSLKEKGIKAMAKAAEEEWKNKVSNIKKSKAQEQFERARGRL